MKLLHEGYAVICRRNWGRLDNSSLIEREFRWGMGAIYIYIYICVYTKKVWIKILRNCDYVLL
jgi:hypothetical protein